jgi:hypothetical protein
MVRATKILTDTITKKFLIAKDGDGNTAWYLAAKKGYTVTDELYESALSEVILQYPVFATEIKIRTALEPVENNV